MSAVRVTTVLAAAAVLAAAGFAWRANEKSSAATSAQLARGAAVYAAACASCHGTNLEGQPHWRSPGPDGRLPAPPHDETGHTWHHSDQLLLDIMTRGTAAVIGGSYASNMPGFGDPYSEADLRAVLEWLKSRWPERERSYQREANGGDS
ncbi:c-type cytochrome [Albidovulum sediminicola]|uniref:C-type cytochrome n=1 Tax=Albidovulum sediminicola TaxID=2984331 RepID=A0ABT2Z692_9RHOB|nr:c-type cytochrome [Defluviimonas sp. WL0075]MCV2866560.1 c-type cytochrome [Defluviimonas sp. WL0075]